MGRRKLTPKEETRIRIAIRDRVMHFSPTISPAPKNMERREIESIASALDFYREAGVKTVILQPKYLGSYCDIYLHRDIEKSRFFSRRGYPVRESLVSHERLVEAARPIHDRFGWDGVELRLIQAEMLPWSALGRGLINRDFEGYRECHQSHCDYLRNSTLTGRLREIVATDEFRQFLTDASMMSNKQLDVKYKQHVRRQYEALRMLVLPNVDAYQRAIDLYAQQVEIYGADGELEFKPFNLLKVVNEDGTEWVNDSNLLGFEAVSDDRHCLCVLDNPKDVEAAYKFFDSLVADNMEGIVIKPLLVWDHTMVPMFKVRNNNYLQMIYGVRFQGDYEYYLERRKVGKKMRCSRNEWNIAQTLLRIPMSDIGPDNEEYKELVRKRILEEDFEMKLDGRL